MNIFSNWQITGLWVVAKLYASTHENGAILGVSIHGSLRLDWLVVMVQKLPSHLLSPQSVFGSVLAEEIGDFGMGFLLCIPQWSLTVPVSCSNILAFTSAPLVISLLKIV